MKTLLQPFGLGDLAYYVFRPVVYLTDLTWGTDMMHCEKCKERRKLWNSWVSVPLWGAIFALTVSLVAIGFLIT